MSETQMCVYILELEDEKYYVGVTKNPQQRIKQHFTGIGAKWTQKYRPLGVVDVVRCQGRYHERNTTFYYMSIYGPNNVRGGGYTTTLPYPRRTVLRLLKKSKSCMYLCHRCGKKGHWSIQCNEEFEVYYFPL